MSHEVLQQHVRELGDLLSQASSAYRGQVANPQRWPHLVAELTEMSSLLANRAQSLALGLHAYASAHADEPLEGTAVLVLHHDLHERWMDSSGSDPSRYAELAREQHGDEFTWARSHQVGRRGLAVMLYGPTAADLDPSTSQDDERAPELVVYGGASREEVSADLSHRGITAALPRFRRPARAGNAFLTLGTGGLYDAYGRLVSHPDMQEDR
ncbi:hypothetical protein [Streptomyces sp. TR02-1]|uniref:hypothetical protein n=1 Tax=Streptomyces sp. TR02-1 TaxID=3385977 RepID=UPI00399F2323